MLFHQSSSNDTDSVGQHLSTRSHCTASTNCQTAGRAGTHTDHPKLEEANLASQDYGDTAEQFWY